MVRKLTFAFAVLFAIVVSIGYVPQFITVQGDERLMFGLFELSLLDDITHGLTAIAAIAAGMSSRKHSLLFLTAFGFYYGLDAVFFLTYGFVNDKSFISDILLNAPHVGIAVGMLGIVYVLDPKRAAAATDQ